MKNSKTIARSFLLKQWKAAYYAGSPIVSDAIYDYHEKLQTEEWPEDPELKIVGGVSKLESSFEQVSEGEAMLSLKKIYDPIELQKFANRALVVELKIDGMSLELRYKEGYLTQAVSRGRGGDLGFDVTTNAMYVKGIPHYIENFTGEIRGEVVQTFSEFEKYKKDCIAKGEKEPAHPRNVATGTMQTKDASLVAARGLSFIGYFICGKEDRFPTEVDVLSFLKEKGFTLPRTSAYKAPEIFNTEIDKQLDVWKKRISEVDYPCDGIVVLYNDRNHRKTLGCATTHPHGARAFKWENETADTELLSIEWNTSRQGNVAPVGIIKEAELSGAKINRVTLHHAGYIKAHNICTGSIIRIIRSGEIIPTHLETISSPPGEVPSLLTHCPSCNAILVYEEGETVGAAELICSNPTCPAQLFERILHYVKIAEIDHLGEGILQGLYDQGYIKSIPDIYLLTEMFLSGLVINGKNLGASRAKKIMIAIEKAMVLPLPKFLAALGIRHIGKGTAERICSIFDSLEKVQAASVQDLLKVEKFGLVRAQGAFEGIQKSAQLIKNLTPLVKIKVDSESLVLPRVLSGLRFVVTGSFSEANPRSQIEKLIQAAGGLIQSSPNQQTSYLVQGEGGGSKAIKAQKYGIPVLDELGIINLLSERSEKLEKQTNSDDEEKPLLTVQGGESSNEQEQEDNN